MAKVKSRGLQKERWLWSSLFFLLLTITAWTGLSLVDVVHETRGLYGDLGNIQKEQDFLLNELSRLTLEQGALGSMQNIEAVAVSELDMLFPDRVEQVLD